MTNISDTHQASASTQAAADLTPAQTWLESLSYSAVLGLLMAETNGLFESLQDLKNDSSFLDDPSNGHKLYGQLEALYNTYQYGLMDNSHITDTQKAAVNDNSDVADLRLMLNAAFDPANGTSLTTALANHDYSTVQNILQSLTSSTNKEFLNKLVWTTQDVYNDIHNALSENPNFKPVALPSDLVSTLSTDMQNILTLLQDIQSNPGNIQADASKLMTAFTTFFQALQGAFQGSELTSAQKMTLGAYVAPFIVDVANAYDPKSGVTLLKAIKDQSTSEMEAVLTDLTSNLDSNKYLGSMITAGQTFESDIQSGASSAKMAATASTNWVDQLGFGGTVAVLFVELEDLSSTLGQLKDHPDYFNSSGSEYPNCLYGELENLYKTLVAIQNSGLSTDQKNQITDALSPLKQLFALSDGTTTLQEALASGDKSEVEKIFAANTGAFPSLASDASEAFNQIKALGQSLNPPKITLPQELVNNIVAWLNELHTILKDVTGDPSIYNQGPASDNMFIRGVEIFFTQAFDSLKSFMGSSDYSEGQKVLVGMILAPLIQELGTISGPSADDPNQQVTLFQAIKSGNADDIQSILEQNYNNTNDWHFASQIANVDIGDTINTLEKFAAS